MHAAASEASQSVATVGTKTSAARNSGRYAAYMNSVAAPRHHAGAKKNAIGNAAAPGQRHRRIGLGNRNRVRNAACAWPTNRRGPIPNGAIAGRVRNRRRNKK